MCVGSENIIILWNGVSLHSDRTYKDWSLLDHRVWSGVKQGNDSYPTSTETGYII